MVGADLIGRAEYINIWNCNKSPISHSDTKKTGQTDFGGQYPHSGSLSSRIFVGIFLMFCRVCLLVKARGGRTVPRVKRLGYCAGSKNSNSEIGLAHE